jgi:hypothetical protein
VIAIVVKGNVTALDPKLPGTLMVTVSEVSTTMPVGGVSNRGAGREGCSESEDSASDPSCGD